MKNNTIILLAAVAFAYWYWKKHRFDDSTGKDPG